MLIENAVEGTGVEIVRTSEPFEDPDEMLAFLDREAADRLGGIILFHAAYTAGEIGAYLARWLRERQLPLLSWSFPDPASERLSANSLCCQNFLLNILTRCGVRYAWLHVPPNGETPVEISRFIRTVRARDRLRFGKAIHVGGSRVPGFYDGEADELAVMRNFGLRFDRVDLQAVVALAQRVEERGVRRLLQSLVDAPQCRRNDVPDEQALQTLRLCVAIARLSAESGYMGCTFKSWPELFDLYHCACDGAVAMLNDWGLCVVEEGEMNGLLSSLVLHLLSGGSAVPTMLDLSSVDIDRNRIGLWHCGATATRWIKHGTQFEARRHSILENADPESAVGLMVEFLLQTGPATVLRYQSPDASRALAFEGQLLDCTMPFRGTYGELEPAPADAGQLMGTILGQGLDHHWSLGYGHWASDVRMLNLWLGIDEVQVTGSSTLSGLSDCRQGGRRS